MVPAIRWRQGFFHDKNTRKLPGSMIPVFLHLEQFSGFQTVLVPLVVLLTETVLLCINTSCPAPESENSNCTYTVYLMIKQYLPGRWNIRPSAEQRLREIAHAQSWSIFNIEGPHKTNVDKEGWVKHAGRACNLCYAGGRIKYQSNSTKQGALDIRM